MDHAGVVMTTGISRQLVTDYFAACVARDSARLAQVLAHAFERGICIAGDLAEMQAATIELAVVVQGKTRDFGHLACCARIGAPNQ